MLNKTKEMVTAGISQGKDALIEYMSLESELTCAQQVLAVMMESGDHSVPSKIIKNAKGFVFMTEVKAGLLVSAS